MMPRLALSFTVAPPMIASSRFPYWWLVLILLTLGGMKGEPFHFPPTPAVNQDITEQMTPETRGVVAGSREELFERYGVQRAHRAGWRGQGRTIAVLDSGFRGYREALGRGLPAKVLVKSFHRQGDLEARDSQHGVLCAEVLHALAPEARLILANWDPDQPDSFLQAVRWAKEQGARICTCSVIMPSWSDGEGGGQLHLTLAKLLGDENDPDGMLFCACAGNLAQRHWLGRLRPNERGEHQWREGKISNRLTPWGTERVLVEMYGRLTAPCILEVWSNNKLIGETRYLPRGEETWSKATVRIEPQKGQAFEVRVRWAGGKLPEEPFHLVALGGQLETVTPAGSIPFPGDGPRVLTIGAVNDLRERTSYSSCGPNSRFPKPDLVAEVPFPSRLREKPFSGTSAAAPQAAGLAALLWSGHPDWTSGQVVRSLRKLALDLGPPGHDHETGFGLLRLP